MSDPTHPGRMPSRSPRCRPWRVALISAAMLLAASVAWAGSGAAAGAIPPSSIAFVGDREIDVVQTDGAGLRRLVRVQGDRAVGEMAWARDGRRLVFEQREPTG